jgi:hypothetical protein
MIFKHHSIICALAFTFILGITGCEEDLPEPVPADPDDLRYEGSWLGSTSQTKLFTFAVENQSTGPVITTCKLGYLHNSEYRLRIIANPAGLSDIKNGNFNFALPDGGNVSGSFNAPDFCDGAISLPDGSSGSLQSHYFYVVADPGQNNLLYVAQTSFTVGGTEYKYEQDFDFYFPVNKNTLTDSGIIVGSAFHRKYGSDPEGIPLIEIRAGHFENFDDIPRLFSPGKKNFSKNTGGGFEIIFYNPEEYFSPYSTSENDGNQEGSNLEIVAFEEMETLDPEVRLYKFIARFNCRTYRIWGHTRVITHGYYVGYIDNRQ